MIRKLCLAHHAQSMRYKCGKIDEDRLCGDDERPHRVNVTEIDGGENHAAGWAKYSYPVGYELEAGRVIPWTKGGP